jgi:hypothetical protein
MKSKEQQDEFNMKLLEGLNIIEKKLVKESDSSKSESHKSLEEKGKVKSANRHQHHPQRHSHKRVGNNSSLSPVRSYKRSGVDELRGEMNKIKPPTFDSECWSRLCFLSRHKFHFLMLKIERWFLYFPSVVSKSLKLYQCKQR